MSRLRYVTSCICSASHYTRMHQEAPRDNSQAPSGSAPSGSLGASSALLTFSSSSGISFASLQDVLSFMTGAQGARGPRQRRARQQGRCASDPARTIPKRGAAPAGGKQPALAHAFTTNNALPCPTAAPRAGPNTTPRSFTSGYLGDSIQRSRHFLNQPGFCPQNHEMMLPAQQHGHEVRKSQRLVQAKCLSACIATTSAGANNSERIPVLLAEA